MKPFVIIAAVVAAIVAGTGLTIMWERYDATALQKRLKTVISTVRAYEEAYALRHGHYLMVPDSCAQPASAAWKELGMKPPKPEQGCYRVEPREPAAAGAVTAPTMQIVVLVPSHKLQAVEGDDDKKPAWTPLKTGN